MGEDIQSIDVVSYQDIKDVGRGAAFHITVSSLHMKEDTPIALLVTARIAILAPNETTNVDGDIILMWDNVEPNPDGSKHVFITVVILCWDSRGTRHEIRYRLFVVKNALDGVTPTGVGDAIAPGVMLLDRRSVARSGWFLKLRTQLTRIPGLRRMRRIEPTYFM